MTDEFLEAVAKGRRRQRHRQVEQGTQIEAKVKEEVEETTEQAPTLGFDGTPSFAIKGPGSNGLELLGTRSTLRGIRRSDRQGQLSRWGGESGNWLEPLFRA